MCEFKKIKIKQEEEKEAKELFEIYFRSKENVNGIINIIENFKNKEIKSTHKSDNGDDRAFILDDKFSQLGVDDITTASVRLTRQAKRDFDKFASKNKQYKKVHIMSQALEEFIKKYQ